MGVLPGQELAAAFDAAVRCLERHRGAIDALNVYPVPDGDTGINMLLTLRAALERCPRDADAAAGQVAAGLAEGAFLGARGNSGVIFSQFLRGLADAMQGQVTCDAATLADGFRRATEASYRAVSRPVEGTMLTVIRALAEAAQAALSAGEQDPVALWDTGFQAAREALAHTPDQLPVLREAGVVDAGGMGVVVIMGGVLCRLGRMDSERLDQVVATGYLGPASAGRPGITSDFLASTQEVEWGYCTQFLIQKPDGGQDLSPDLVRGQLTGLDDATSAVVVGDQHQVRVHVHLQDPGRALSLAVALGQLSEVKVENMARQNHQWAAGHGAEA
ncbi:MAG TPA: DAK2 domain-containing protein, partial [Dehalococcoidia bacterium]|nr:DAK2 domain-containing protein [Dehalococcoidia bacterium]